MSRGWNHIGLGALVMAGGPWLVSQLTSLTTTRNTGNPGVDKADALLSHINAMLLNGYGSVLQLIGVVMLMFGVMQVVWYRRRNGAAPLFTRRADPALGAAHKAVTASPAATEPDDIIADPAPKEGRFEQPTFPEPRGYIQSNSAGSGFTQPVFSDRPGEQEVSQ